jgi:hypothetical protein
MENRYGEHVAPVICAGKIKLPKRLMKEGVDDGCYNFAFKKCSDCNKWLCHIHIKKDKHECVGVKE